MKKLVNLMIFLCVGLSNAQVISFTDPDFKQKLLQSDVTNNIAKTLGGNNIKIDADDNGEITVQEVAAVYELSIPNEININSIEGILSFVNLTVLDARNCSISGTVNLSNLVFLDYVYLNNNQITAINLSGCIAMREIDCNDNLLEVIDVSTLFNLEDLKVNNNPILQIFAKNGAAEAIDFGGLLSQNINYICVDEIQVAFIQGQVTNGCIVNSFCTNFPGGNYNTITGLLLFDREGNGQDITDLPHAYVKIKSVLGNDDSINLQTVTQENAVYTMTTGEIGDFDVIPATENPTWFTISNVSGNFIDTNNNVFTQDFLLAPVGVHFDVEVMIRPLSAVISGSTCSYEIVYKNKGNQPHFGQLNFNYNDTLLDFITSSTPLVNSGTGSLSLTYSNLLPFETRTFQILLQVSNTVTSGDILNFSMDIDTTGEDIISQSDNSFLYKQKVQSLNPNRIECLEGDLLPLTAIGKYLHYAINFENTSSEMARNITIKTDFDPTKFNVDGIQIMNASHPLNLRVENEKAVFNFRNANIGGPGGQGGILLKVPTNSDLSAGETVNNSVEIFFDYNSLQVAPILATPETAATTFQDLSLATFSSNIDNSIVVFPNPTTSILNIESDSTIEMIELFDVFGRLLQTKLTKQPSATIDLSLKANGIYFVKITSSKGQRIEQIVKE